MIVLGVMFSGVRSIIGGILIAFGFAIGVAEGGGGGGGGGVDSEGFGSRAGSERRVARICRSRSAGYRGGGIVAVGR